MCIRDRIRIAGRPLHHAISYGVSQALLDAVAKASHRLMCEVVAEEYGCAIAERPIPIFAQTGDDRYANEMCIRDSPISWGRRWS